MNWEPTARATAAADQMAAAVVQGQPKMIELAHLYLAQGTDRAVTLAKLFRHLSATPQNPTTVHILYADALLRLAEAEGRAALTGEAPPPAPPA